MTDYEGVLQFILAESSITSLLGTYLDSTQPLAVVGTIPKDETGIPSISVRNGLSIGQYGISENLVEVHCYGETEPDSKVLAQAVFDFFRNSKGTVTVDGDSFSSKFEATILTSIPDQKQTNTIVELKLDYR